MAYRGARKSFGAKQPSKAEQMAAFMRLLCGARTLESLPAITALASMYRLDPKEVEYHIGVERRRRSESEAAAL